MIRTFVHKLARLHKGQEPGRLKLHASKALGPLLAPRLMKKRLE